MGELRGGREQSARVSFAAETRENHPRASLQVPHLLEPFWLADNPAGRGHTARDSFAVTLNQQGWSRCRWHARAEGANATQSPPALDHIHPIQPAILVGAIVPPYTKSVRRREWCR